MTESELEQHALAILNSARIRNKYVFLCEGDLSDIFANKRHSPSSLRQLEKLPDSSFYTACLHKNIKTYNRPEFFNCGGRSDVIKVYNKLKDLCLKDQEKYFLNFEKTFVILDLDIQIANINSDKTTEDIYKSLYKNMSIIDENILDNKILVTGLIHKEAYFLLPRYSKLIKEYKNPLIYLRNELKLENIYTDIIKEIEDDKDLLIHLDIVKNRIDWEVESIEDIKKFFLEHCIDEDLIKKLFTIRKVKPYWEKITTLDPIDNQKLREQLELTIANQISINNDSNCHITAIFNKILLSE